MTEWKTRGAAELLAELTGASSSSASSLDGSTAAALANTGGSSVLSSSSEPPSSSSTSDHFDDIALLPQAVRVAILARLAAVEAQAVQGDAADDARLELAMIALIGKTNTSRIETFNAYIRRILRTRSHAKTMHFQDLSAQFVLTQHSTLCKAFRQPAGLKTHSVRKLRRDSKAYSRHQQPKTKVSRGFGPFRISVKERCHTLKRKLYAGMRDEYNALSPSEIRFQWQMHKIASAIPEPFNISCDEGQSPG